MKTNKSDALRRLRTAQLNIKELEAVMIKIAPKFPYAVKTLMMEKQSQLDEIRMLRDFMKNMGWANETK